MIGTQITQIKASLEDGLLSFPITDLDEKGQSAEEVVELEKIIEQAKQILV